MATSLEAQTPAEVRLGLREARQLVEHTPAFSNAESIGQCPQTSDAIANGDVATIILRGGCKHFDWIANFEVNLNTGTVTLDQPGGPSVIESEALAELRKSAFAARIKAQISIAEASCLLMKASLGPEGACRRIKVDRENDSTLWATVENPCGEAGEKSPIAVAVDRYDGSIADARTNRKYDFVDGGTFRQALLIAHTPIALTVDQAKDLVQSPTALHLMVQSLPSGKACLNLNVEPFNNADEFWLDVESGCGDQKRVARLSVNASTGAMRAIGSKTDLDSTALRGLRANALAEARSRAMKATVLVGEACPDRRN